jgi:type I restriction enzyme S subunit
MFRSSPLQEQLEAIANGVAQQNLSPIETQGILVLLPPEALRQHFANTAAGFLRLALTLLRSNTNLRTTRDLLLPRLISGELDVSAIPKPEALAA